MRRIAIALAFLCFGCSASIAPSTPPSSVSLLNSDFEQLKQDEKKYWEDNARAVDAFRGFQRKLADFKASLTKQQQERFDQFWKNPSTDAALYIILPDIPPDIVRRWRKGEFKTGVPEDVWARLAPLAAKGDKAVELYNKWLDFFRLADRLDERERELKTRRNSLEQRRRDIIAHYETLAALADMQQQQAQQALLFGTGLLLGLSARPRTLQPLPPPIVVPPPSPPQRGIITGPGGNYYYREY